MPELTLTPPIPPSSKLAPLEKRALRLAVQVCLGFQIVPHPLPGGPIA